MSSLDALVESVSLLSQGPLPNLITAFAHREPTIKLGEFRWIELYSKRIHFRRVGLTALPLSSERRESYLQFGHDQCAPLAGCSGVLARVGRFNLLRRPICDLYLGRTLLRRPLTARS